MEFLMAFDVQWRRLSQERRTLGQDRSEWFAFLEFCEGYFRHRGIRPVVVEIGTLQNAQKGFFTELLGAEHIGIDIEPRSGADIIGQSQSAGTYECLKTVLRGRGIDLLFIDGDHHCEAIEMDWGMYSPLTRHIVAFHDVLCDNEESVQVGQFWDRLKARDTESTFIMFHRRRSHERTGIWDDHEMGIGVLVKAGR